MKEATARTDGRLSLKENLGYGVGDVAFNLLINTTSLYLLFFYTDVFVIGAASAGVIFLVSKLWNAAIDPFIGYCIDRTNSRWGKMRPYMLFGAVPLAACFFLIFASPGVSGELRFLYGMATFLIFNTVFAFVNVPYAALTATLAKESHERSRLTGFRMTFATVGMLLAAVATKPLVHLFSSNEITGFRVTSVIFGAVAVAVIILSFASVHERHVPAADEEKDFRRNIAAMLKNRPFIFLVLSYVSTGVGVYTTAITVNYFFKYNLANESLISAAFAALFVAAVVVIPLWVIVSKKIGKRNSLMAGLTVFMAILVAIYFIRDITPLQLVLLLAVAGTGMATFSLFPWAMVPDTVEYSRWKAGVLQQGFLYGFFVFGLKVAQALAGFIGGTVLEYFGYVPNTAQSPAALEGIRLSMTLLPCAFIAAGILLLLFYPISAKMHRRMVEEIEQRSARK
jgi:glycoside/pentoside/hexuronide:cation symporter, GPH family